MYKAQIATYKYPFYNQKRYAVPGTQRLVQATPQMLKRDQSLPALGGNRQNYEDMNNMLTASEQLVQPSARGIDAVQSLHAFGSQRPNYENMSNVMTAERLVQPTVNEIDSVQSLKAFGGNVGCRNSAVCSGAVCANYDKSNCCGNKGKACTEFFTLPYSSDAVETAETQQLFDNGHDFIMFPNDYIMTNANLDPRDHTKVKYRWNGFLKLSESPSYSLCTKAENFTPKTNTSSLSTDTSITNLAQGTPGGPFSAKGLRVTEREPYESCVNNDAIDDFIYPPRHCMYNAEGYMTCHQKYLGY